MDITNPLNINKNIDAAVDELKKDEPNRKVLAKNYALVLGKSFATSFAIGFATTIVVGTAVVGIAALVTTIKDHQS